MHDVKLKMLIKLLVEKGAALQQLLTICENQETLILALSADEPDLEGGRLMHREMNNEKQRLIDVILQKDEIFQTVFGEISGDLDAIAKTNRELLVAVQDNIKTVTDLDAKIRVQEARNRDMLKKLQKKVDVTPISKKHIIGEYAKNAGKRKGDV